MENSQHRLDSNKDELTYERKLENIKNNSEEYKKKTYVLDREFFDITTNFNWDMNDVDRSFDPEKIEKYLSLLTDNDKDFITELLKKTTYIKYAQFKVSLLKCLELFFNNISNEEFFLLLPTDRIGSEHWLTSLLWSLLKQKNIRGIIDEDTELEDKFYNILIIDDALYTGTNTFSKID